MTRPVPGMRPRRPSPAVPPCTAAAAPIGRSAVDGGLSARAAVVAVCLLAAAAAACGAGAAPQSVTSDSALNAHAKQPDALTADATLLLQTVRAARDNAGAPFMVIDKREARVWVFSGDAELKASSPVLLGLAVGDDSVPGIGDRPIAQILPLERTTPAGRFVLEPGRNLSGEDILWVDYDAAVSMHRVRATNAAERRLQRLASATPVDNRISYGCINVPAAFYNQNIHPVFTTQKGLVYVLPETRPVATLFGPATKTMPPGR